MSHASPTRPRRGRRRWLLLVLLVLVLGAAALALLARPFGGVRTDAENARAELARATASLKAGDLQAARRHQRAAQQYVDHARAATDGVGGDVWSVLPVAGGAVHDVRHLVSALDDASTVVADGIRLYPVVMRDRGGLVRADGSVDLPALERALHTVRSAGTALLHARSELDQVRGTTPRVGASLADARDRAQAEVGPLAHDYERFRPMVDTLPALLGAEGQRTYVVMVLNPAELRYSGGAALVGSLVEVSEGRITVEDAETLTLLGTAKPVRWPKVLGNVFHKYQARLALQNATLNPNWSVSGEEFLRGFGRASHRHADGLVVLDPGALARLLAVTSPIPSAGYGTLTADNLVAKLSGSYDTYTDVEKRRRYNAALVPGFTERLFAGGRFVEKLQALGDAAGAREFAMYLRDPAAQQVLHELGVDGDLSTTDADYVGVFSQNTNISKVDYYQRRSVRSDVRLRGDGSARVRLQVDVHNDTPPYAGPEPDPRRVSYQTRWAGLSLAAFLPMDAQVRSLALDGRPVPDPKVARSLDRPFVRQALTLEPGARGRMVVEYDVPHAATVDGDRLTYSLAVDPQGLVRPESLAVSVRLPHGFTASRLPAGWTSTGRTVSTRVPALTTSPRWEVRASR